MLLRYDRSQIGRAEKRPLNLGRPSLNREAKRLVRNSWGDLPLAIRRCSVAPELRRGRVGSEAAEHARRSYLAALRTAGGQSMTKGTTIATAFAATGFGRVSAAATGLRHDGHFAADGACGDGRQKPGHCQATAEKSSSHAGSPEGK